MLDFLGILWDILGYLIAWGFMLICTLIPIQFLRELIKTGDWKRKDIPRNLFALSVYALIAGGLWYLIGYKFIWGAIGEFHEDFRLALLSLLGCEC